MRLLVVGKLSGQLSTAVKMAMSAGAKVSHVETIEAATRAAAASASYAAEPSPKSRMKDRGGRDPSDLLCTAPG